MRGEPRMSARIAIALALGVLSSTLGAQENDENRPLVESDGTVHVPAFDLPESAYLSDESRQAMRHFREVYGPSFGSFSAGCPSLFALGDDLEAIREARQCIAEGYYETAIYKDTRAKHPVRISHTQMGGVYTEVFEPEAGITAANKDRLLISIHGGGFVVGARYFSHTEAMQVADMGRIRVISPDYRMAPEFEHPAGIEDVIAVYREALDDYAAEKIGIYGCSAGAMLTAQVVTQILIDELPLPGAIGLFCAGAAMTDQSPGVFKTNRSESAYFVAARSGRPRPVATEPGTASGYFANARADDRTVAPGDNDELLAQFPPTLLISGTRDFLLSGVIATHRKLRGLGVDADLHIWEGLGHATFAFNPRLPESDEVHQTIVDFFDRHLE